MKFFASLAAAAGLALTAVGAQAQVPGPYERGASYRAASDFGGPYAAMPPQRYGYGPRLLPPEEVYTVLRESGFSPLGIPRQRGFVYTIAVIGHGGDSGRLVIDARDGRIVRFVPTNRIGENFGGDLTMNDGPAGPLPPTRPVAGTPRSQAPLPHVASRTVPVPKASPLAAKPAPEPAQQSAAVQPKAAEPPATPPAAPPSVGLTPPAAQAVQPTQEMPNAQGLE